MPVGEQWVDLDDVSIHLKVNKETIRRWIKERGFPSHRAGNLFRFKLSEVDSWVRKDGDTATSKASSKSVTGEK